MSAAEFATVFFNLILVNNYVLVQFLGICPFLGVSKKLDSAVGMSVAVTFVMVLATAATWPIQTYLLDRYELCHPGGGRCVVLVYEKHCWRPGSPFSLSLTSVADRRITLTVTADDYEGAGLTRLHCVSGGGGRGLLDADRGEAGEFENAVLRALDDIRD